MSDCEVSEPGLRCVLPFEAAPSEVRLLRTAAASQLSRWGMPADADEVALLVTELATNVVKHVGEGVSAVLILEWRDERLRIEMHDRSRAMPALVSLSCDEECGRGLHLLGMLAADWGTVLTAAGKSVWCEVELGAQQSCRRLERAAAALENYQGNGVGPRGVIRAGLEASAIELIADLLHWTAARGYDPDDILDRAQMHYEAETGAA
ncbi:ATP-binding protein [Streptomyces monashensis]|uniref:ATP-binding protein n=1 Tax=Streptomyces monashensis TaxID=1678012 RepID=A0A1S2Q0B1_9ACTN|nr:ATP-binding protein [Streptomyces monashensis]OIJ99473.1 ATP-binding protein [Streptomyces monashensis]